MFISKKELEGIRNTIKTLQKENKSLKQSISSFKENQELKNKEYDESLAKRYLREEYEKQQKKEAQGILDEWLNGAKKEAKK